MARAKAKVETEIPVLVEAVPAVPTVPVPKPGWKTSEFWVTVAAAAAGPVLEAVIPAAQAEGPKTAAWTSAILAGIYTLSRTYAKR